MFLFAVSNLCLFFRPRNSILSYITAISARVASRFGLKLCHSSFVHVCQFGMPASHSDKYLNRISNYVTTASLHTLSKFSTHLSFYCSTLLNLTH